MTSKSSNQPKPPIPLPRDLIVLSCIWIAASWIVSIGLSSPAHPVAASYVDALLMMCTLTACGVTIAWPLLRLSFGTFIRPYAQTVLDMVVLICAIQVVVWPLRLLSTWPIQQTAIIAGLLTAWVLLTGGFVLFGLSSNRGSVRTTTMMALMVVVAIGALIPTTTEIPWWNPISGISAALQSRTYSTDGTPFWNGASAVFTTLIASLGLWIAVSGARIAGYPSSAPESERVNS